MTEREILNEIVETIFSANIQTGGDRISTFTAILNILLTNGIIKYDNGYYYVVDKDNNFNTIRR